MITEDVWPQITLVVKRGEMDGETVYSISSPNVPGLFLCGTVDKVFADIPWAVALLSDLNNHDPWKAA